MHLRGLTTIDIDSASIGVVIVVSDFNPCAGPKQQ